MATLANPNSSDEELMAAYLRGEMPAFQILYQRYSGKVFGYLTQRLSRREEAEEVFQAVFLKFHRSRAQYDPQFPVLQWLFVISRSVVLDHLRKQGRQVPLDEGESLENLSEALSQEAPSPSLSEQEVEALHLTKLSPEQKEVVSMRVLSELSYAEIAKRLGRSQESVRQVFSRALKRLRAVPPATRSEK